MSMSGEDLFEGFSIRFPGPQGQLATVTDRRYMSMDRLIEVGTGLSPRSPLRTGRADLPHPALQSVVCSITETGICRFPGIQQAEEPEFREVAVGPALVIDATATAFQAVPLS